jgi:hypothetical protein
MMMMYQMSILEVKEARGIMTMTIFYHLSMRTRIVATARTVNKKKQCTSKIIKIKARIDKLKAEM